ncbi:MAG: hypothetical protein KF746_02110 [Chitinophagaceae bacterium]|nr:hypothetical protein [Chitinophagaceae bacterium]
MKKANLKKMNSFLLELIDAQESGKKSITTLEELQEDIKTSRKVLKICIETHEKLSAVPIFGQKFA